MKKLYLTIVIGILLINIISLTSAEISTANPYAKEKYEGATVTTLRCLNTNCYYNIVPTKESNLGTTNRMISQVGEEKYTENKSISYLGIPLELVGYRKICTEFKIENKTRLNCTIIDNIKEGNLSVPMAKKRIVNLTDEELEIKREIDLKIFLDNAKPEEKSKSPSIIEKLKEIILKLG